MLRLLVVLALLSSLITTETITASYNQKIIYTEVLWQQNCGETLSIKGRSGEIEEAVFWQNDSLDFSTGMVALQGIFHINTTVRSYSNSSVHFAFITRSYVFTPINNYTLFPGESYAENYTLLESPADYSGGIIIVATVVTEGSNATVFIRWEVIAEGTIPYQWLLLLPWILPGLLAIVIIAITIAVIIFRNQRKLREKHQILFPQLPLGKLF